MLLLIETHNAEDLEYRTTLRTRSPYRWEDICWMVWDDHLILHVDYSTCELLGGYTLLEIQIDASWDPPTFTLRSIRTPQPLRVTLNQAIDYPNGCSAPPEWFSLHKEPLTTLIQQTLRRHIPHLTNEIQVRIPTI